MAEARNRKLPKSQEQLAEAVKENNRVNASADELALAPLVTAEVGAGTSKLLNTPRDLSRVVNNPL